MIEKMCKVEVVGSKKRLPQILEKIQVLGNLHVEEVPLLSPRPDKFKLHRIPLTEEQYSEKSILEKGADHLDEVLRMMGPVLQEKSKEALQSSVIPGTFSGDSQQLFEKANRFLKESSEVRHKEVTLLEQKRILENYTAILKSLVPLVAANSKIGQYRYIGITLSKEGKEVFRLLEEECAKITNKQSQIYKSPVDKSVALIGFPPEYEQKIKTTILGQGINEVKLPASLENKPFTESLGAIEKKISELSQDIEALTQAKKTYFQKNGKEIFVLRHWSYSQLKRLNVLEQLAQSHYTFVIIGWLPEKELNAFRKELESFGKEVVVNRLTPSRKDYGRVPVCLKNPKCLKSFELLLKLFPPPTYGTVDVTFLIGLVFPFFFGFILGDVFYGLVLAAFAFYLKKRFASVPLMQPALKIIKACWIWTVVFGVFYGEFLGNMGHSLGMKPFLYVREVDILLTLGISIGIGVAHILLGIFLSIFIAYKSGDRHGFWANVSYFLCIIDILLVLGSMMGFLPAFWFRPTLWALAGLIPWLMYLHGGIAPLELISTLGNILSYARLMAIGLASVVMAIIANKFVTVFESMILGLSIAIFLHVVNFALGVFAPTIQSLRLHYVEFFTKFFKPEGRAYQPFNMGVN